MNGLELFLNEGDAERVYTPLREMLQNTPLKVSKFWFIEGEFGRNIALELENKMWTVLPPRFSQHIRTEGDLANLNKKKMVFTYSGQTELQGGRSRHNVSLKEEK